MAFKITLDSFLAVIKRSALLSEEQVDSALETFRTSEGAVEEAKPFASYLVKNKLLTVWQAEKVLQGKHKGFVLGRYRLLSLLGKGGMSSVYLAEHMVMKRHCALKVLPAKRVNDASYLGRFHREAQAVAALDHPNIVRAYDVDMATDGGVEIHFLAMEFVKGKSLLELVQEKGPVDVADAADMVRQSALGLEHAHRAGLVHRDVKPGNLLVTSDGLIKVLDLGLARFFEDDGDHSLTVQHDERVLGTADYISPEQAIDSHKVDARTDIYSLGCTFYYLLVGHPPFNTGSLAQRLIAHQTQLPPPIHKLRPDVPPSLQAIIEKMMAKKMEERYQSAQEVADALTDWLANPSSEQSNEEMTNSTAAVPAVSSSPIITIPDSVGLKEIASTDNARTAGGTLTNSAVQRSAGETTSSVLSDSPDAIDLAPDTTGSKVARKSSKRLTPAPAGDASKASSSRPDAAGASKKGKMGGSDVDLLDQVFNPSLLDEGDIDYNEDADDSDARLNAQWRNSLSKSGLKRPKKKKKTFGSKFVMFFADIPPILWVVGLALLGLIGVTAWVVFGGVLSPSLVSPPLTQSTSPGSPTASEGSVPVVSPATPDGVPGAPVIPTVVDVGPQGQFPTITQAISFVREKVPRTEEQPGCTIQVAGGQIYTESIQISGGAGSPFPRNIVIKSVGPTPAVIQGVGGQPVLSLQDVESLTVSGFTIDAQGAKTAVRIGGHCPSVRLDTLIVKNFIGTGVHFENVSGKSGTECQLSSSLIKGTSSEAVGILCSAASGGNTTYVQMTNLRIVGPLRIGVETNGMFWNASLSDSMISKCVAGIRCQPGALLVVTLMNNTFFRNQRGIVFAQVPDVGSSNVKVWQNLFQGNFQADAVLEAGDVPTLTNMLFTTDSLHGNRTNRKDPDPQGIDLFSGDGQRGVATSFVTDDEDKPEYLKPKEGDLKVASPAPGAKDYVGAVAP